MNDRVLPFTVPPVVKAVIVNCAVEKAFRLFTADLAKWWPLTRFHYGDDPQTCLIEPRVGGRVYERSADGTESVWGQVEAWEPPRRLGFTWLVGAPAQHPQHIEVTSPRKTTAPAWFSSTPGGRRSASARPRCATPTTEAG